MDIVKKIIFLVIVLLPTLVFTASKQQVSVPVTVPAATAQAMPAEAVQASNQSSGLRVLKVSLKNNNQASGGVATVQAKADSQSSIENIVEKPAQPSQASQFLTQAFEKCATFASAQQLPQVSKWQIFCATVGMSYAFIVYKMYYGYQLTQSLQAWCNFKEAIDFGRLQLLSHKDLVGDLLFDIQKKYALRSAQTIGLSSESVGVDLGKKLANSYGMQFLADVQNEIAILQTYSKLCKMAEYVGYSKIFIFAVSVQIIEEKIARLQFLIDLFIGWQLQNL